MRYLYNIQTSLPKFQIPQIELGQYMAEQYDFSEEEKAKLMLMYKRSGIANRHSCLPDFNLTETNKELFINQDEPSVSKRMETYFKHALPLATEAAFDALQGEKISHLITVSCTGMAAPGLDLMLIDTLHLPLHTHRSSVNFMGCYAYFHALKIADAYCQSDPHARVLIVSVELCTIHFNKAKDTDQIAANLLFADGAAACLVSAQRPNHNAYFSIDSFYSKIVPQGKSDMAWKIHETGFLMTLSAYIPQILQSSIKPIIEEALSIKNSTITNIQHWGIHPGGRKILDYLSAELGLTQTDLRASYAVLNEVGNLSSSTILFVLQNILNRDGYSPNQPCFTAGFGPGLTIETMLLNHATHSV
ncbi:MAG: type III polyketide synthase [Sphingobacteriales bacterium]|nr:type III polyketide synthase [Sphingobacteriales bacterium]